MIVWIASYPKSGNTWIRSIISALVYTENGMFDFEKLKYIPQFPDKRYFKDLTDNYSDFNILKKCWIPAQERINLDKKVKFFKTHHINCKVGEYSFTNDIHTKAKIYVVRDPRNLVNSISNHYSKTHDEAIKFLTTPRFIGGLQKKGGINKDDLITLIGTWQEHYKFWTQNKNNLLTLKYEDLVNDTEKELVKLIEFLKNYIKFSISKIKIKNILETTSFTNLKKMEQLGLFTENAFNKKENKKVNFFHLGKENRWENILEKKHQIKIEKHFEKEMQELKYIF